MRTSIVGFAVGVLFAVGLGISGMTLPSRIIGFLDFFGDWDPSLVFVMGGAVVVYFLMFRFGRGVAPPFGREYSLPLRKQIDRRLVIGAALFGIGWGLAGYCPGPALTTLGSGSVGAGVFVVAMVGGMLAFRVVIPTRAGR